MKEKRSSRELPRPLLLFLLMARMGLVTFGGGWSLIEQLRQEFVEKRGWLSGETFTDIISLGRSLPGIMVINTSVIFGYNVGGIACALAAAAGCALPAVVVLSVVSLFYSAFAANIYVAKALIGVRAAVVPIILKAVFSLRKSAVRDLFQFIVASVVLVICICFRVSYPLMIVCGAVCGLVYMGVREHGAA